MYETSFKMSQEFIEFPRSIKSCSVVLERLDEKLLSQYSQKHNIKTVDVIKHSKIYINNFSDYSKRNKQKVKKSVKINKLKKRSDDESSNEFSKVIKHILTSVKDGVIKDSSRKIEKISDDSRSLEISNSIDAEKEIEVIQEFTKSQKENLEDQNDLREDNEDDKITVIFEETSTKKCETECSVEIVRSKLSTIRTSESEGKVVEKSAVNEPIRENYFKKLCSLVKRLHELFRIISQLQRSEPQNDNLAAHFLKVIKAQRTSFLKEIKLSEKPVIECYGKLLTFYKNSNEVISKISQNTLLSQEDVSNIISRCLLRGKLQHVQRNNKIQPKDLKKASNNFKKPFIGKEINNTAPQLQSFPLSEDVSYHYEIIPTADESGNSMVTPAGKDVVTIQKPSNHGLKRFLPSYNDHYNQKQNIWTQEGYQNQVFDPLRRASSSNDFRHPSMVPNSLNLNSYPQYMTSNFLVNPTISQKRPSIEFSAPNFQQFYVLNVIQQKSILEQVSLGNFNSPLQDVSTCASVRELYAQKGNLAFPSNVYHKDVQRLARHPLGGYFNDSVRISKQNSCGWLANGEEIFEKPSFNNIDANEVAQEVLDLTVPGYLQVKNYSTQGSTAVRVTEENKRELFQSFSEMENCSGLRKESSNFRIYFCAQSNCKMPGIRICKGCQSVIYCSANCQLKHWALKHKTECYQLRELRVA